MIEYKSVELQLPSGNRVKITFKQFQNGGDWFCQMDDQIMDDFVDVLERETHDYAH